MDKIVKSNVPLIRMEILESPNFLTQICIAIRAGEQEQLEAINAHLDILPGLRQIEKTLDEHETEIN